MSVNNLWMNIYKRHRFPPQITSFAVWLYHRFSLSHRDIEDLLAERGTTVSRESIRLWCIKFGPEIAQRLRRKRPYIEPAWCAEILATPLRRLQQPDGRVRWWGEVAVPGETQPRILRVVTLADGQTVHNAFFDRGFRRRTT